MILVYAACASAVTALPVGRVSARPPERKGEGGAHGPERRQRTRGRHVAGLEAASRVARGAKSVGGERLAECETERESRRLACLGAVGERARPGQRSIGRSREQKVGKSGVSVARGAAHLHDQSVTSSRYFVEVPAFG